MRDQKQQTARPLRRPHPRASALLFSFLTSFTFALCLLPFALCLSLSAAEPAVRVAALRSEASGSILDVLLKVQIAGPAGQDLTPGNFAVYIAPAELSQARAMTPPYRLPRLFLKRLSGAYYIDLRQLPAAVEGVACQLVLRVERDGKVLATHTIGRLLEAPAEKLDVALLIDESLSMRRTDSETLRLAAAKTFVDLAYHSPRIARIAVIAFNHRARVLAPLTPTAKAETIYRAIDRVRATGQTDMDDALRAALDAFDLGEASAGALVLLTDGKDEPGRYNDAHRPFIARRWPVYTVGLSRRADTEVLQRIARDTGGEYHEAPTNADLQHIFSKICLSLQKKVPIRTRSLALEPGRVAEDAVHVDDTISALTLSLRSRTAGAGFTLRDPAGSAITAASIATGRGVSTGRVSHAMKAGFQYYELWGPAPGRWVSQVTSQQRGEATLAAMARTPLLLRAFPLKPSYYRGEPVEVAASLAVADSVLGNARVEARVTAADGKTVAVPLFDDGKHDDTAANDGVFGGYFPGSDAPGGCAIRLVATGTTPGGHRFERELDVRATVSTEAHSKLWCSARDIDFGVLYSGEQATRAIELKLASAVDARLAEDIRVRVEPPAPSAGTAFPQAACRLTPSALRLEAGRVTAAGFALTVAAAQAPGLYRGRIELASRYDRIELPVRVEVRRPRLVVDRKAIDFGALESGGSARAAFTVRLDPRGAVPLRLAASDPRLGVAPGEGTASAEPTTARLTLTTPRDLGTTAIQATVSIDTPIGKASLPVTAKVVRPAFVVSPATLDFGELEPGKSARRELTLRLDGVAPRQAQLVAAPLSRTREPGEMPLSVSPTALRLEPGAEAACTVRIDAPPLQQQGDYSGTITIRTPLGERKVGCRVRVPAIQTFRVVGEIDFGDVAVGTRKQTVVELESLVDAEQELHIAAGAIDPERGWRLELSPRSVVLPPHGRAGVVVSFGAELPARAEPFRALAGVTGPLHHDGVAVRARIVRPPHESLWVDRADINLGTVRSHSEHRMVLEVRSSVDEPQRVVVEGPGASGDIARVEVTPREWTLPPRGSQLLIVVVRSAEGRDEQPFDAAFELRGRSLPAAIRVRGVVATRPTLTVEVQPAALDFGRMRPGDEEILLAAVHSLHHREQTVSFAARLGAEGVVPDAPAGSTILAPGEVWDLPIMLAVAPEAAPGERRLTWVVQGAGDPVTLEARVEVVAAARERLVARSEPTGIGWGEGAFIIMLLLLLLAALVAAWLLARWLLRTQRIPRMAKYFALSALVHAMVLFTALDLLIARKVQQKQLGPTFKVGLKAVAGSLFSSQQGSAADALRSSQEQARRLAAQRRRSEGQRLARALLEAEKRRLDPSRARMERPKPDERPSLTRPRPRDKKHSLEELARLLEEISEQERVRQTRKTTPDTPVETRTERVARVRSMTRAELDAAVRRVLEPKAREAERPAAPPVAPGMAQPKLAEKAAPSLDDLVPAIEDLKAEMAAGASDAASGGRLTARQVGPTKAGRSAAIERGTAASARAAAEARDTQESTGGGQPGRSAPAPVLESGRRSAPARLAAGPSFEVPDEGPLASAGGPAAPAPAPAGGGVAARSIGPARATRGAVAERHAAGGATAAEVSARPAAPGGPLGSGRAVSAAGLAPSRSPSAAARVARPGFDVPDESPGVDPAVSLPGAPGAARLDATAVAVARPAGGGPVAVEGPVRGGAQAAGTGRPEVGARGSAAGRAESAVGLPAAGGARASKAAPDLDGFVVVEGPLVEPRQSAPSPGGGPAARTVVARWRLRGGTDSRADLTASAAGGGAASVGLSPRAPAAGRVEGGSPLPGVEAVARGPKPRASVGDAPTEAVDAAPGIAVARDAGGGASDVAVERATGAAIVERQSTGAGVGPAERAAPGPRGMAATSAADPGAPLPLADASEAVGRRDLVMDAGVAEEAVEAGPRVAAPGPGPGVAERDVAPAAVRRSAREIARAPQQSPKRSLAPRVASARRTPGRATTHLLLPGVSGQTAGTGAVVGSATGAVTNIILTTVRYGSGEADWDTHKTTMPFLAWQLREQIGFNIDTQIAEVPLESPKVMKSPWIYMSGHKDFRFTAAQVANLRRYLVGGGTLWADDSTHEDDTTWDRAFRREIARVLRRADGYRLVRITKADDHPLFRSCFDLREGYAGYFPPPGDKYRQTFIEGVEIDGRLAVIYTRNDYGDGLEIQPDTFPLKASLSGLSPAEMQESSFLMATNVIVYILTRGRGVGGQGILARAAASLRQRHAERRTRRDPYADAPATLFDDFAQDTWLADGEWDQAGSATVAYLRHEKADATGRRLAATYRLKGGEAKIVLTHDLPAELDLTGQDRCYVDVESRIKGGARLSLALVTLPGWKYFESRPAFLKPGRNRVHFDLKAATWKTGDPVPEGKTEFCRRVGGADAVRRVVLLLYPVGRQGTVVLDRVEFRTRR